MAAINELITVGIGTPATISYFIRFGIGSGVQATIYVAPNHKLIVPQRNNTLTVPPRINQLTHDF